MLHRFFCSGNGFTTWHRNCCMGTSLSLMLCGFSHCVHEQSDALSGVPLIGHAWRSPVIVSTQQYCHTIFLCFFVVVVVSEMPKAVITFISGLSLYVLYLWTDFVSKAMRTKMFTASQQTFPRFPGSLVRQCAKVEAPTGSSVLPWCEMHTQLWFMHSVQTSMSAL